MAAYLLSQARPERAPARAFPIPSAAHSLQVEVFNGTHRQGYARAATRLLRRRGIDVVFLGNADSLSDSTRILVRRGGEARGTAVAQALGAGRILVQTDTLRRVDVSVILGEDFRPPAELHP